MYDFLTVGKVWHLNDYMSARFADREMLICDFVSVKEVLDKTK